MIQNSLTLKVRLRQFDIWTITVQGVLTASGLEFQRAKCTHARARLEGRVTTIKRLFSLEHYFFRFEKKRSYLLMEDDNITTTLSRLSLLRVNFDRSCVSLKC